MKPVIKEVWGSRKEGTFILGTRFCFVVSSPHLVSPADMKCIPGLQNQQPGPAYNQLASRSLALTSLVTLPISPDFLFEQWHLWIPGGLYLQISFHSATLNFNYRRFEPRPWFLSDLQKTRHCTLSLGQFKVFWLPVL